MKPILPLILLVVVTFISCEKDLIKSPEPTDPDAVEESAQLKFILKNLNSGKPDTDKEGYDDYNFLGFGYDVTGKYAHKSAIRHAIINTPLLVAENEGRFDSMRVLQSSFKTIYATDALDFMRALTGSTPEVPYFAGSITNPFPGTELNSDQHIYGLYDSYIRYKRFTLYGRNSIFVSYLTETFRADSRDLDPAALVKKYGTHVLLSLYTGAKLSLTYQAEYTGDDRKKAVENSFRIGLADCFDLFSGFLDPVDSTALKGVNDPVVAFEAIGGDPSKILIDETSISKPIVNRTSWAESVSEDNARFIYFDDLENLLPISDLIEDVKKKEEIKAYIEDYTKTNSVKL